MKVHALAMLGLAFATGCRTAPEPTGGSSGYKGIERIQILAKGMEWTPWVKGVKDAFARLSGAKTTTVNLAEGLIFADTDPSKPVNPSQFWNEVRRVGFLPEKMEVWAMGRFEEDSFTLDGGRWLLVNAAPQDRGPRRAHFRVLIGGDERSLLEFLD